MTAESIQIVGLDNLPDLVRPAELAAVLGVAKTTLWRWSKAGNGPKRITIGGTVFFARADIQHWLNAHRREGV